MIARTAIGNIAGPVVTPRPSHVCGNRMRTDRGNRGGRLATHALARGSEDPAARAGAATPRWPSSGGIRPACDVLAQERAAMMWGTAWSTLRTGVVLYSIHGV